MIPLAPGANAQNVIRVLTELIASARSTMGSASDPAERLDRYRGFSINTQRHLRTNLSPTFIDNWFDTSISRLAHSVDPHSYPPLTLDALVSAALETLTTSLEEARDQLTAEFDRWDMRGAITFSPSQHIGVLDTNVLILHAGKLREVDWNTPLDARIGEPISLVIPQAVVRELDRLKRSTGKMRVGSELVEQRSLARRALRVIDESFLYDDTVSALKTRTEGHPVISAVRLVLQLDTLRHAALADSDAEIIDRALTLLPFGATVTLLTGDTSMRLRARHVGLRAVEITSDI